MSEADVIADFSSEDTLSWWDNADVYYANNVNEGAVLPVPPIRGDLWRRGKNEDYRHTGDYTITAAADFEDIRQWSASRRRHLARINFTDPAGATLAISASTL